MIKLSIITVSFNSSKTIERTIKSILFNSTNKNYELEYIIIDGCSSDNTVDIAKKYNVKKIISEPDNGIYDAMNKGIKLSDGDYIGIVNSDDWLEDGILNKISELLESNKEVDILHGNLNVVPINKPSYTLKPKLTKPLLDYGFPLYHPTFFVRKELYEEVGYFNLEYPTVSDYDFYMKTKGKYKYLYFDECISNFSIGGVSSSNLRIAERIKVRVDNGMNLIIASLYVVVVQVVRKFFFRR